MALDVLAEVPPSVQLSEIDASFAQPGIYFLWHDDAIVYVGQSKNVSKRLVDHMMDRLKAFERVSFQPCPRKELLKTERYFIEALLPKYNRCGTSEFIR